VACVRTPALLFAANTTLSGRKGWNVSGHWPFDCRRCACHATGLRFIASGVRRMKNQRRALAQNILLLCPSVASDAFVLVPPPGRT
jgi:hypothetical protein